MNQVIIKPLFVDIISCFRHVWVRGQERTEALWSTPVREALWSTGQPQGSPKSLIRTLPIVCLAGLFLGNIFKQGSWLKS